MFFVTAKTGPYAVAPDEQRHGWVVIDQESQQPVEPERVYRTAVDALHAAIHRAAYGDRGEVTVVRHMAPRTKFG